MGATLQPAKSQVASTALGVCQTRADGAAEPVEGAAQREQVERILLSTAFHGRDSLKRLLAYLLERTIDGTAGELKEYTIGIEVFHKPEGYDPQQDGSVRQHVGKLRQKLDEYYRTEGNADPIRIELPKRHFRLEFQEPEQAQAQVQPASGRPKSYWTAIACLFLLLPLAYWIGSVRASAALDPAVRLVWAPFLDSARPTVVCLGTPLFLRNRSFRVRDSHLNATDTPEAQARIQELEGKLGLDSLVPTFDYTGIGEAYAAFGIARVFGQAHREACRTRANVLSWDDIRAKT